LLECFINSTYLQIAWREALRLLRNPSGLNPASKNVTKEPEFYWESSKVKPAKLEVDVRYIHNAGAMSTSAHDAAKNLGSIPAAAGYARVAHLQKEWLASDALMVWQKRGFRDSGPYYATIASCVVMVGYCFYLLGRMSFPKKAE